MKQNHSKDVMALLIFCVLCVSEWSFDSYQIQIIVFQTRWSIFYYSCRYLIILVDILLSLNIKFSIRLFVDTSFELG